MRKTRRSKRGGARKTREHPRKQRQQHASSARRSFFDVKSTNTRAPKTRHKVTPKPKTTAVQGQGPGGSGKSRGGVIHKSRDVWPKSAMREEMS